MKPVEYMVAGAGGNRLEFQAFLSEEGVAQTIKYRLREPNWLERHLLRCQDSIRKEIDTRQTIYVRGTEERMNNIRKAQQLGALIRLQGEGKGFLLIHAKLDMMEPYPYGVTPKRDHHPLRIAKNGTFELEEKILTIFN